MPQPSDVRIQQDAGPEHDDFARRIEKIAAECAPLMEDVTGLAMPPALTIRLVDAGTWTAECRADHGRRFAADVIDLKPRPERYRAVERKKRRTNFVEARSWLGAGARTIDSADGAPEILMVPDSARRAGRYDDHEYLLFMMAHELCHPAQHHAGPTFRAVPSLFQEERRTERLALHHVIEGHATWAAKGITAQLLGRPVQPDPAPPSTRLHRFVMRVAKWADANVPYEKGFAFVVHVLDGDNALAPERFNRLWNHVDLFPTLEELDVPDTWLSRVAPLLEEKPT